MYVCARGCMTLSTHSIYVQSVYICIYMIMRIYIYIYIFSRLHDTLYSWCMSVECVYTCIYQYTYSSRLHYTLHTYTIHIYTYINIKNLQPPVLPYNSEENTCQNGKYHKCCHVFIYLQLYAHVFTYVVIHTTYVHIHGNNARQNGKYHSHTHMCLYVNR